MEPRETRYPGIEPTPDVSREMLHLGPQLDEFLHLTRAKLEGRNVSDFERRMEWAYVFTRSFLESRTLRALEIGSSLIVKAQEMARHFYGYDVRDYQVTCMDGRNQPEVSMSRVPHVGGVMRTAAGDFEGYREGSDGKILIDPTSNTYESIDYIVTKSNRRIYYSFDSHFGCAARGASEKLAGSVAKDGGLAADIRRKMKLAGAILDRREELVGQGKNPSELAPLFYSYDPHDGTMTMGLEAAIDEIGADGYSPDVLDALHEQGKIVRAWDFLEDETIVQELQSQVKPADFRDTYTLSMYDNWEAISKLYDNGGGLVFSKIVNRLQNAYKKNSWVIGEADDFRNKHISDGALLHKAKIMLQNIVTRWSIAEHKRGSHVWPFGEHNEEAVVLTEGGNGPYPIIDTFAVYNKGEIPKNTKTAVGIVRTLRSNRAVADNISIYSQEEFPNAPVMIMNTVVVRDLTPVGRGFLATRNTGPIFGSIDWDRIALENNPKAYEHVVEEAASTMFHGTGIGYEDADQIRKGLARVIGNFQWLTSDPDTQPLIQTGSVVVCSILIDENRKPLAVVPLVY